MGSTYTGRLDVELWGRLKAAMAPLGDDQLIGNIVDVIEQGGGFRSVTAPPPDHRAVKLDLAGQWYAIESKELSIIGAVSGFIGGSAKLATATGIAAGASAGIGLLGGLITFSLSAWRRHIPLEPEQGLLLYGIKQRGGRATADRLAAAYGLDVDDVNATLEGMRSLRRTDNTLAEIVDRDDEAGEWLAVGV